MRSAASFLYMILIDLVLFPTTAFILQDCFHKSKGGGIKFANTNLKKTDFATSASDIPDREVTNLDDFYTDDRNTTISALPRLNWNAAVISSVRVQERDRTCEEYMRLPASECKYLMECDSLLVPATLPLMKPEVGNMTLNKMVDIMTNSSYFNYPKPQTVFYRLSK